MLLIRRAGAVFLFVLTMLAGVACGDDTDDENPDGTGEPQENRTSLPDTQETNPPLSPEE